MPHQRKDANNRGTFLTLDGQKFDVSSIVHESTERIPQEVIVVTRKPRLEKSLYPRLEQLEEKVRLNNEASVPRDDGQDNVPRRQERSCTTSCSSSSASSSSPSRSYSWSTSSSRSFSSKSYSSSTESSSGDRVAAQAAAQGFDKTGAVQQVSPRAEKDEDCHRRPIVSRPATYGDMSPSSSCKRVSFKEPGQQAPSSFPTSTLPHSPQPQSERNNKNRSPEGEPRILRTKQRLQDQSQHNDRHCPSSRDGLPSRGEPNLPRTEQWQSLWSSSVQKHSPPSSPRKEPMEWPQQKSRRSSWSSSPQPQWEDNDEYDKHNSPISPREQRRRELWRQEQSPHSYDRSWSTSGQHPARSESYENSPVETTYVDVTADLKLPLHGAKETLQALQHGHVVTTTCVVCQATLRCVDNAQYVICPECKCLSPLEHDHKHVAVGGVGLGLLTLC